MALRLVLLLVLLSLTACGKSLQQALAPDPRLLPSAAPPSLPAPTVSPFPTSPAPLANPTASPEPTAINPTLSGNTNNQYLNELQKLGVISPTEAQQPLSSIVNRQKYARWLLAAYNKIHQTNPSQQLKLATADTPPSFVDVPANHPDFIPIQSLANAGIIPSALSGSSNSNTFQPDLPLTREKLILWKVPLDHHQALPPAAAEQKNWEFQDAAKISPAILPAMLADYQNGDKSNIRRAFGYTTLFQPQKPVTLAEALSTIWYFGTNDGRSAHDAIVNASPSPSS